MCGILSMLLLHRYQWINRQRVAVVNCRACWLSAWGKAALGRYSRCSICIRKLPWSRLKFISLIKTNDIVAVSIGTENKCPQAMRINWQWRRHPVITWHPKYPNASTPWIRTYNSSSLCVILSPGSSLISFRLKPLERLKDWPIERSR